MEKWNANIINNPNNDYNLMIEINYGETEVAAIKMEESGLELKLYAHDKDLKIPVEWLLDLLNRANMDLANKHKK